MTLDRTAIKQLQKRVYYGLYADVANELKVTRASVMNVVAGKWYNQRIIDEVIRQIELREASVKQITRKIAKLK